MTRLYTDVIVFAFGVIVMIASSPLSMELFINPGLS